MRTGTFDNNTGYMTKTRTTRKAGKKTEEQKQHDLAVSITNQFNQTVARVQLAYGTVGKLMGESAVKAIKDDEFVSFLFLFVDGIQYFNTDDKEPLFLQSVSSALLSYKLLQKLPINVSCHIEEVMLGDRYLRRFMMAFLDDVISNTDINSTCND